MDKKTEIEPNATNLGDLAGDISDLACDLSDFGFDYGELLSGDEKPKTNPKTKPADLNAGKSVQVIQTRNRHAERRVLSELALEKELPWHFEEGTSYHCISWGDVDALTYIRAIVKQQKIKFGLLSTWCAASEDVREIRAWIEKGYIGRMDFYIGEIFKATYFKQYGELVDLCKTLGGRVAIFRNHAKVAVLFGERFDAVIEGSANVNTNPRCEQTIITIDGELAAWYKKFFDGIRSFERDFDDVQPWQENPR